MKKNLFLVLNPLQIICAQEARERFCKDDFNHLVLINRNKIGSLEYCQKINELDECWSKITELGEPKSRSFKRIIIRLRNTSLILKHHGFRRGKVFLGDAYLNWFRYLGVIFGQEVVWLDDGASTINIIPKFRQAGLLNGPNLTTPKFFTLFGSDELAVETKNAVMVNNLEYLKRKKFQKQAVKPNTALFVGQWLSEKGGVDQTREIDILRCVSKDLTGWNMKYVRHRHESPEKLHEISSFMEIVSLSTSIEASMLASEYAPEKVLSWYSTALFTLKPLLPNSEFHAVKVPLEKGTPKQVAEWLAVYDALGKCNIPIIDYT